MAVSKARWAVRIVLVLIVAGFAAVGVQAWRVKQPSYIWQRAQQCLRAGEREQAKLHLQNLLQKVPDHAQARLSLARLLLDEAEANGEPATYAEQPLALEQLTKAAELITDDVTLQKTLMLAQRDCGHFRDATAAAARVAKLDATDVEALFLLGCQEFRLKRYAETEELANKLAAQEPRPRFRTLGLKVQLYEATGDLDRVKQTLSAAVDTAAAHDREQLAALDSLDHEAMIELLFRAIDQSAGLAQAHQRADVALAVLEDLAHTVRGEQGRLGRIAAAAIRLGGMLHTKYPVPRGSTADQATRTVLIERVAALGKSAVEAKEASPAVCYQTALATIVCEDDVGAIEILEQGIAAGADLPTSQKKDLLELHMLAARRLVMLRRFTQAEKHLAPLMADKASSGWGHLLSGSVALAEGRLEQAHRHFLQARPALGDMLLVNLGLANTSLALTHWKEALPHLASLHIDFDKLDAEERAWARRLVGDGNGVHKAELQAYLALGDLTKAQPHLEAIRGTDVEPQGLQVMFDYLWTHDLKFQALDLLHDARRRFPRDLGLLLTEVSLRCEEGAIHDANKLIERFAADNASDLAAQLALVRWRASRGRHADATAQIEALRERFPNDATLKVVQAEVLLAAGESQRALALADELRQNPETESAASVIGARAALKLQNLEEAGRMLGAAEKDEQQRNGAHRLLKGRLAAAQGDLALAVDSLSASLEFTGVKDPARVALLQSLMLLAQQKGPAEVEDKVVELLKSYPDEPFLVLAKADLAIQQKNFEAGLHELDRLEKLQPTSPVPPYFKARVWSVRYRPDAALAELDRAIKLQPTHVPSHALAAEIKLAKKQDSAALAHAATALKQDAKLWNLYLIQAEALNRLSRHADAVKVLHVLIAAQPKMADAHLALAATHLASEHTEQALRAIEAGRRELPDEMEFVPKQLVLLCKLDRAQEAERIARSFAVTRQPVDEAAPRESVAWNCLLAIAPASPFDGFSLTVLSMRDKFAAKPLDPVEIADVSKCMMVATAFQSAGQPARARAWAERAFLDATAEQKPVIHLLLGNACLRERRETGDRSLLAKAREHFAAVLAAEPTNLIAGNNLAWLLATEFDQPQRALELADKLRGGVAVDRLPTAFVDTLATIYRKTDRRGDACTMLEQIVKSRPDEPLLQLQLGLVYAASNRQDEARTAIEAALRLGLTRDRAEEAKRELAALQAGNSDVAAPSKPDVPVPLEQ